MKLNLFHILILINVYCSPGDGDSNVDYWQDEKKYDYAALQRGELHIIAAPRSKCFQFQIISDSYPTIHISDGKTFQKKLTVSIDRKEETTAATVQTASVHDYSINVTSKTIEPCCVDVMPPRRFWMSWKHNLLRIGRDSEVEPIIQYNYDVSYPNILMQHLQFMSKDAFLNLMYLKSEWANCPLPPTQKESSSSSCDDIHYDITAVLHKEKRYELRVTSHRHMLFQFKTDSDSYLQLVFGTYRLSKFQPKLHAYFDVIKQAENNKVQLTQVYDYSIGTEATSVPEKRDVLPLSGPTDYNVSWVDNVLIINTRRSCEVVPILQYKYNITEPNVDITHIQYELVGRSLTADIKISTKEKQDYLYMLSIDRNQQYLYDVMEDDCLEFNITTTQYLRLVMGYYRDSVFQVTLYADLAVWVQDQPSYPGSIQNQLFDYALDFFPVIHSRSAFYNAKVPINYWVTWRNGILKIGLNDNYRPIIQYQYATQPEDYLTHFEFQLQDMAYSANLTIAKYAYCPKGRNPRSS